MGVLINHALRGICTEKLDLVARDPDDDHIVRAIVSVKGFKSRILPDQAVIEMTITKLVGTYKEPLEDITKYIKDDLLIKGTQHVTKRPNPINYVYSLFMTAVKDTSKRCKLNAFPNLEEEVFRILIAKLDDCQESAANLLSSYVDANKSCINVDHPDFQA